MKMVIDSISMLNKEFSHLQFLVLQNGLSKNFAHVEVSIVDCPDLTKKPFNIAAKGKIFFMV